MTQLYVQKRFVNRKGLPRGPRIRREIHIAANGLAKTKFALALGHALAYLGTILLLAVSFDWTTMSWKWLLYPIGALIAARQMRGLECLVHEASHFNWIRRPRSLNDVSANLLAAVPMGMTVAGYRRQHFIHHNSYGSDKDPDYVRLQELNIYNLISDNSTALIFGLVVRFPKYWIGWMKAIGTRPRNIGLWLAWHSMVLSGLILFQMSIGMPAENAFRNVVISWGLFWLLPMAFLLPFIRFVGEIDEHAYPSPDCSSDATLFNTTITNHGFLHKLLIHPTGDGYHLAHHLFPSVPGWSLRIMHNHMIDLDPALRAQILERRTLSLRKWSGSKPFAEQYGTSL